MKYKTIAVSVMALLAILFSTAFTASAQATSFDESIPTYGLYCADSELIKSGAVKFNLTDMEMLSKGMGVKHSEYKVSAANREVEFAIPFISSATNVPAISVSVNGQTVDGSIWYGHSGFWQDYDFDIEKTYSPVLDESITGTLYSVIPDKDTITVTLSFSEKSSYIYETSSDYSSSHSVEGSNTWTLRNALSKQKYYFFVMGDATGHTFSSSCEYETATLTCKEFIDSRYKDFKEYYDYSGSVPLEFLYSVINKVLQSNSSISYEDLFFRSISTFRVNVYKFSISLKADTVISYELPISVQRNYAFEPLIYLVEQKNSGNYFTDYTIELNADIPYIIESSVSTERSGTVYEAETAEDFYFVFCSSKKPTNTLAKNNGTDRTVLISCLVVGSVALIGIAVILGIVFYRRKAK